MNGQLCKLTGRMKEWEELTKDDQNYIAGLIADMLVEDYLDPPAIVPLLSQGSLSSSEG